MIIASLLVFVSSILVVNYLFTRWFIRYARVRRITDIPSERSSHKVPTPKGGGVGFVGTFVLAFAVYMLVYSLYASSALLSFLTIMVMISALGWYDDKHDLSKRVRFGIQSLAAIGIIVFVEGMEVIYVPIAGFTEPGILGGVLAFIWITGTGNIYNFMDGVDGIATVQAITASLGWMIFAWLWAIPDLFAMNLFLLGALVVFLKFNWSPAKIFMGDVGSLFLGFAFAAMPFVAANLSDSIGSGEAIWLAGIMLWPFLFDGSYTIFRRLSREENIFKAHRSHLYQRLNISGWSHNRISILYLVFSVFCILGAVLFYYGNDWLKIVILLSLMIISFMYVKFVRSVEREVESA